MAIEGTGRLERIARHVQVALAYAWNVENGYEPEIHVAATPTSITLEAESTHTEGVVVSIALSRRHPGS